MPAKLRFGPAGKPLNFKGDMLRVPEYLARMGLDALEYEAVRGVRISEEKARKLGEEARRYNIVLSLHAPYYVNLASKEEVKLKASIRRVIESMKAAYWMGAYVVVVHVGYYKGHESHRSALMRALNALKHIEDQVRQLGIKNVWIGPETTGKKTQIGSVEEIIEICNNIEMCRPVIDWAHLHARALGMHIRTVDEVIRVLDELEKNLDPRVLKPLHQHFSKIEYSSGGEKEHHTLSEEEYGPDFRMVCRGLKEVGVEGVIISESPVLDKDALVMKAICCEEENYC